jgi:peptidoglycan/LPS O-acetylase OafA/YrhL
MIIYVGIIIYFSGFHSAFLNTQTARGLMGFFLGIIVGEIYRYIENNGRWSKCVVFLCLIGIVCYTLPAIIFGYSGLVDWKIITTFLFFPSFIIIILTFDSLSSMFSKKPFLYLGRLSYSIYLFHFPIFLMIKNIDNYFNLSLDYSSKAFCLIYVAIVLFFSHLLHFFFEEPMQNYILKKLLVAK